LPIILKIYGKNILKPLILLNALKLDGITTAIEILRYTDKPDSSKTETSSKELSKELNMNF